MTAQSATGPAEREEGSAGLVLSGTVLPTERAHLHGNNPDVAHVHHEGVTWGHVLANLGFGVREEYLVLDRGRMYTAGEGRTLKFVLNGQLQFSVQRVGPLRRPPPDHLRAGERGGSAPHPVSPRRVHGRGVQPAAGPGRMLRCA